MTSRNSLSVHAPESVFSLTVPTTMRQLRHEWSMGVSMSPLRDHAFHTIEDGVTAEGVYAFGGMSVDEVNRYASDWIRSTTPGRAFVRGGGDLAPSTRTTWIATSYWLLCSHRLRRSSPLRTRVGQIARQRNVEIGADMSGTSEAPESTHGLNRSPRRTDRCECDPDYECSCDDFGPSRRSPAHGTPFLSPKGDPDRRLVGIEVEYNDRTNLSGWIAKWNGAVHTDGSCGWEAVTTPLAGEHVRKCMRDLVKEIKEGSGADEACGVHVHVDARDLSWADMLRVCTVYAKLEPLLYAVGGQQRTSGTYCKTIGTDMGEAVREVDAKGSVLRVAFSQLSAEAARERVRYGVDKKDGGRYKGLNIIPWIAGRKHAAKDTTIEFRMHENTLSAYRIANWALLCSRIVEWCHRATDAEVAALPESPLRALCTVIAPASGTFVLKRVIKWRARTVPVRVHSRRYDFPVRNAHNRLVSPRITGVIAARKVA